MEGKVKFVLNKMDDNNEFLNDIELQYDCSQERSCTLSDSFKELHPDDCTCSLTQQNIAINDHNDAIILYIGRYRSIQI